MDKLTADPRVVSFSTRVYRGLLATYPGNFKREYASPMAQVFRDCCLHAFQSKGLPGVVSFWSLTLFDYIKSVFEEHIRRGFHVSASRFIRLGGWAWIFGTIILLAGLTVETQISGHALSSDPYSYYSRPIDHFLALFPILLVPAALLLFSVGVLGLYQRCSLKTSRFGKAGLLAAISGGILAFTTCTADGSGGLIQFLLANRVDRYYWPSDLAILAWALLFGGIFLFGIDEVMRPILPRWNFILIPGSAFYLLKSLAGYIQAVTHSPFYTESAGMHLVDILVLIITSLSLTALGYLLITDVPREDQPVMS
jgi:hypothetical protein